MVWVSAVVLVAILQFIVLGMLVGMARGRFNVPAPATTGHPTFDRLFRAHQNSLEMLIAFIPCIWLYGWWVSQTWATALGLIYLAARIIYVIQYVKDPKSRHFGAGLSFVILFILVLGDLYAVLRLGLSR